MVNKAEKEYWPLIVLVIFSVASTIFGIYINPNGFLINLLSDIPSALVSVFVSVLIITTILSKQQAQKWQNAQKLLNTQLIQLLNSFAAEFIDLHPKIKLGEYESLTNTPLSTDQKTKNKTLIGKLCQDVKKVLEDDQYIESQKRLGFLEGIYLYRGEISKFFFAYLLFPIVDPKQVEVLQELENSMFKLEKTLIQFRASKAISPILYSEVLISVINDIYKSYNYLSENTLE